MVFQILGSVRGGFARPEGIFKGEGGGILNPPACGRNFIRSLLLSTPTTPRRVFSGVVGGGHVKFCPANFDVVIDRECLRLFFFCKA